jgi:hypothetical protein
MDRQPDRIGNGNISNRSVSHAFDPTAFAIPGCPATNPVCSNPVQLGRWGNSGLNILQGPPIRNLDFALLKDFKYRDRVTLRFNNHDECVEPPELLPSSGEYQFTGDGGSDQRPDEGVGGRSVAA